MIRKLCTTGAVVAAVLMGTAGVANAATPNLVPTTPPVAVCVGGVGVNCDHDGGHRGGRGGNFGHGFGGNFGGRGGFYPGGFYRGLNGNVLSYSQLVSSCGCGGDSIPAGYVLVSDPQVVEVPSYAVEAGDTSCATLLPSGAFGRFGGGFRGGRWHR